MDHIYLRTGSLIEYTMFPFLRSTAIQVIPFAALKMQRLFLAVSGVGNWRGVVPLLRVLRPRKVITSFDMDKTQNPSVALHLKEMTECLIRQGFRTYEANWDRRFKGIDDVIAGEGR